MNLEDYRTLFAATCLVLILVAASPALSVVFPFSVREQRFSELWVLGPTHMIEDYPFHFSIGEEKQIFVGIRNYLGHSAYYVVYVKLRNQTQALPNSSMSEPSPLDPLYEFRSVVSEGATWEVPVFFSLIEASRFGDLLTVKRMSIDDVVLEVNSSSLWDSGDNGFFYQLFFELWMYDWAGSSFRYHNRFVGVWLNVTG